MIKDLLEQAHYKCCQRENVSSFVLLNSFVSSGSSAQAITAAISCFGDKHAPVDRAFSLLTHDKYEHVVKLNIKLGVRVPGWGSQFVKGNDPIFNDILVYLDYSFPELMRRIDRITEILIDNGKYVYPNAACMTAAVGSLLGYTEKTIHFLLIECRLRAWMETIKQYEESGSVFFRPKLETKDQTQTVSS